MDYFKYDFWKKILLLRFEMYFKKTMYFCFWHFEHRKPSAIDIASIQEKAHISMGDISSKS